MAEHGGRKAWKRFLNNNRIFFLAVIVFVVMSLWAPRFLTVRNMASILKGLAMNTLPAAGLTMVLIVGRLDLTIGVNLTLGGMVTVLAQPHWGWGPALAAGILAGAAVGLLNGLLITRAKVNDFICTLGVMIIVQGVIFILCKGGTVTASDYSLGEWIDHRFWYVLSPRFCIVTALALVAELLLQRTRAGRNLFLIGGNPQTAWHSGIGVDRYITAVFIVSAALSALGGGLFAISINSTNPNIGTNSLMTVIAAVIIGGTSMAGGRGSIIKSLTALLTLSLLINGFSCLGAGWEIQRIASGAVLAAVIVWDAWLTVGRDRVRGQRRELLEELREAEKARS